MGSRIPRPEPDLVNENELLKLELNSSRGPGPDDVPSLILKNCASAFGHWKQVIGNVYLPR
jgi:hypothetical protein